MSAFEHLAPELKAVTEERGWKPTPIQEITIEPLLAGDDLLVLAPTGSGKTEAAVLPLLSRAITESWEGIGILYVTPLRALNRDVERRIHDLAGAVSLKSDVRHGDTTQYQRTKQAKNPPHLLVTTPETCQLLLQGSRLREGMRNLHAVVIDEIHDLAASERGAQLSVALARIDELCGRKIQRVGLSATVGNPDEMATWLSDSAKPCHATAPRPIEVEVVTELANADDRAMSIELQVSPQGLAALRKLTTKVEESAPCLIFVNSRNAAETVAQRISKIDPKLRIGVHHGSLARETREQMEADLQSGTLDGLVCTSSLELGIDVGSIKQVHQVQSPRAVDRLLQRIGRSEHILGGTSRGMILCWEADEIGEAAVIARRARDGELEPASWRTSPMTVAANQLVLTSISERIIPLAAAKSILSRSNLFKDIDDDSVLGALRILDDRRLIRLVENHHDSDPMNWPPILWEIIGSGEPDLPQKRPTLEELSQLTEKEKDIYASALRAGLPQHLKEGWFSPGSRSRDYMQRRLSMIADETYYSVRDVVTRRSLGKVDETFVLSLDSVGAEEDGEPRRFVMAGRTWEIVDADPEKSELLVAPVSDQGSAPVWSGELPPVPAKVAREVGWLRLAIAGDHGFVMEEEDIGFSPLVEAWIASLPSMREVDSYPVSDTSLGLLTQNVLEHIESTNSVPHPRLLTIEKRRDAIVLNSTHGSRVNQALAHFVQAMASTVDGKSGRVIVDPYRITFQVPALTMDSMVTWLRETPPEALSDIMRMTIPNGRQLRARLVQVCKTFGILQHGIDPRRVNLNGIIHRYRDTVVLDDALDMLFHDRMDVEGATELLRAIQEGAVDIKTTAAGSLGLSPRSERDLLLPNWSKEEVRFRLKDRLLNERAVLICLACGSRTRTRVEVYSEKHERCKCGGRMLATQREGLEERLAEWVQSDDPATRSRMERNAQLVQQRGREALIALMARGVGEDTATRILRKTPKGDLDALLRIIHEAELNYARTRRFWG